MSVAQNSREAGKSSGNFPRHDLRVLHLCGLESFIRLEICVLAAVLCAVRQCDKAMASVKGAYPSLEKLALEVEHAAHEMPEHSL